VADIAALLKAGKTPDEMLVAYPSLNKAQIHAALLYYYENREEIEAVFAQDDAAEAEHERRQTEYLTRRDARRVVYEVRYTKQQDQWQVARRGSGVDATFDRKVEAITDATRRAKAADLGQVVIKKQDGSIQTERTYGQDPRRHKG
jgi:hypothetical protein